MFRTTHNLLRRTFILAGTITAVAFGMPAAGQSPQTAILKNVTGNTCSYTSMTVKPNGAIEVDCTAPIVNPTGATFAITAPATMPANSYSTDLVKIAQTAGPALTTANGAHQVQLTVSGTGCLSKSQTLQYWAGAGSGAGQSWNIDITTTNNGTCTVSIASTGNNTSPGSVNITVGTTTPPPGGPTGPAGCPAPAADYLYQTMDKWKTLNGAPADVWNAVDQLRMASGQIATYEAVAPPQPWLTVALAFTQGQQPAQPGGYSRTEFSVTRCPGVIDNSVPQCYYSSGAINSNMIKIYRGVANGWNSQELVGSRGCYAPDTDASGQAQKWYVNVRWTYTSCSYSNGCGFSMQWAEADPY